MSRQSCADSLIQAIASLFSYNDPGCHPSGAPLPTGSQGLVLIQELNDILPSDLWNKAAQNNFHATLYCEERSGTLILAFRGSVSLTELTSLSPAAINDWLDTNAAAHLGDRPNQYNLADKAADRTETARKVGAFDGKCGSNPRPFLVLAGHSKGGGQAQFAARRNKIPAFVYNSDIVNPNIFTDWMYDNVIVQFLTRDIRRAQSYAACAFGQTHPGLQAYYNSGAIRDVRMVNDELTRMIFAVCGDNLPHAPFDWVVNTLSCSRDGHSIETVARELKVCP